MKGGVVPVCKKRGSQYKGEPLFLSLVDIDVSGPKPKRIWWLMNDSKYEYTDDKEAITAMVNEFGKLDVDAAKLKPRDDLKTADDTANAKAISVCCIAFSID
jgi:hypothetical protein